LIFRWIFADHQTAHQPTDSLIILQINHVRRNELDGAA
jgi:hypothetical protein